MRAWARARSPRSQTAIFFQAGHGLAQFVAGIVRQFGHRGGQHLQRVPRGAHGAFGGLHIAVGAGEAVNGGLMRRDGGGHFPGLFFKVLTGEKRAVGLADALAAPARTQLGESMGKG